MGELKAGQSLPTVRGLAEDVGVNPKYRGSGLSGSSSETALLRLERGLGTFVTESAGSRGLAPDELEPIERICRELVVIARRAGMTVAELGRLVDSIWKVRSGA